VLAFTLGLSAALLWGISDFVAGVQSRSVPLPLVTCASQGASLVLLSLVVTIVSPAVPTAEQLVTTGLGGVAMAVGVTCFYSAMASGAISVAAPIASTGIAIPVGAGLLQGERPASIQLVGIVAAAVGVMLVSRSAQGGPQGDQRRNIALALGAALGFGWFFVGMDAAGNAGANLLWMLLAARIGAFTALCGVAAWVRPPLRLGRRSVGILVSIGMIDLAANASYLLASSAGLMSLVSVLGSLYALVTLVLALKFLRERVSRIQVVGIALSLGGAAMIAIAS
jgi:drug/metabolite transporter (DMT)-like permease